MRMMTSNDSEFIFHREQVLRTYSRKQSAISFSTCSNQTTEQDLISQVPLCGSEDDSFKIEIKCEALDEPKPEVQNMESEMEHSIAVASDEIKIKVEDDDSSDVEFISSAKIKVGDGRVIEESNDSDVIIISDNTNPIRVDNINNIEIIEDLTEEQGSQKSIDEDLINVLGNKETVLCFYEVDSIDEVLNLTSDSSILNCLLCRFKTSKEKNLIEHVKVKHNRKRLQCAFCSFESFHDALMSEHFKYKHSDQDPGTLQTTSADVDQIKFKKKPFKYKCAICNFKCHTKRRLEIHEEKHCEFKCYLCSFKSFTKHCLRRHILRSH